MNAVSAAGVGAVTLGVLAGTIMAAVLGVLWLLVCTSARWKQEPRTETGPLPPDQSPSWREQ